MKIIGSIAFHNLCKILAVEKVSEFKLGNKDRLFVTLYINGGSRDLYLSLQSCKLIEQENLDEKVINDANVIQYEDNGNEFKISISGCSPYATNQEISRMIGMDFQTGNFNMKLFKKGFQYIA
jgi:hypothetical protein